MLEKIFIVLYCIVLYYIIYLCICVFFPEGLQPVVGYTGEGKSVKRKEWQRGDGLD